MNNNYSAIKIGYFVFFITIFLVLSVYIWVKQANIYNTQITKYTSQIDSLTKLSSVNKNINDNVRNWPREFSQGPSPPQKWRLFCQAKNGPLAPGRVPAHG
mgnify:CR=1 FL=1